MKAGRSSAMHAKMLRTPHATEWSRVARAEAKTTKMQEQVLANPPKDRPVTSQRKLRSSVGLTNRPKSVPLDGIDGSQSLENLKHHFEGSQEAGAPFSIVTKNQRMLNRSDKVKSSLYHPTMSWMIQSTGPTAFDLLKSVRQKVSRRSLNVNPFLRKYASADGLIAPEDMKDALIRLNIGLSEAELDFCCTSKDPGSGGKIGCEAFLKSLEVPNYDHGSYDPLGDSRRREIGWLSHTQHLWKDRSQAMTYPWEEKSDPNQSTIQQLPNANVSTLSRYALRKVFDITKKLETGGVPVFEFFKKSDKDGSGTVERSDFEETLKQYSNVGMVKDQVNDLWAQVDREGTKRINYQELQDAVSAAQEKGNPASKAQTSNAAPRPTTQYPWSETRTVRSPCLPSCHFNVRTRRPGEKRNTNDVIVPMEQTSAYCPDWMRSTSVSLNNSWLMDGTGQGSIAQTRKAAKIERKRATEARVAEMVALRELQVEHHDAARINGISRVRHDWIAAMQGIWA